MEVLSRFSSLITNKDQLIGSYFDLIYRFFVIIEMTDGSIEEGYEEFEMNFYSLMEEFHNSLNSSLKSLLYYM